MPPFIPTITGSDDTSNFDEFEPKKPKFIMDDLHNSGSGFSGKDLPFVGFTFTKGLFEAEQRALNLNQDAGGANSRSNLERKLTLRSKELSETRHRVQQMQFSQGNMSTEADKLKKQTVNAEQRAERAEKARDDLERELAEMTSENRRLAHALQLEEDERNNMNAKSLKLLEEIKEQAELQKKLRDEDHREGLECDNEIIETLESENLKLQQTITHLKNEILELQAGQTNASEWRAKLKEVSAFCSFLFSFLQFSQKCKESCRIKMKEAACSFKEQLNEMTAHEMKLQQQLDEVHL